VHKSKIALYFIKFIVLYELQDLRDIASQETSKETMLLKMCFNLKEYLQNFC